jgi:hypothetical protein
MKHKTAILAALAVLTMAALIYVNMQYARNTGPRTSASVQMTPIPDDSSTSTNHGPGETS